MTTEADDYASNEEQDEEAFWGCRLPKPSSGWVRVASCFDGDCLWKPGWESIERATRALFLLDELHGHTPDWGSLLAGFQQLHVLSKPYMKWPPLHHFGDFLELGDLFLNFEGSNDYSVGSLLYINEDQPVQAAALMAEFDELTRRLRDYPPLQPYVQYM